MTLYVPLVFLLAVNIAAFVMFRLDKRSAEIGGGRISEAALLGSALVGGWFGAKLAQRIFRHKTRKQPFGKVLNAVPLMWAAGAFFVAAFASYSMAPETTSVAQHERSTPKFFQSVNR